MRRHKMVANDVRMTKEGCDAEICQPDCREHDADYYMPEMSRSRHAANRRHE